VAGTGEAAHVDDLRVLVAGVVLDQARCHIKRLDDVPMGEIRERGLVQDALSRRGQVALLVLDPQLEASADRRVDALQEAASETGKA
jgi:hypothetical protein